MSDKDVLEVFIYLNRTSIELERGVSKENFALGCTPIVNLFNQRAEPIRLDNRSADYRVVPDARRVGATEVYAIESVTGSAPDGRSRAFEPFFAVHHTTDETPAYWHMARHAATNADGGTEVFLSFVDGNFDAATDSNYTVSVETVCLNRDLPSRLPFGGGNPRLELVQASSALAHLVCATAPTQTLRPPLGRGTRSRLVSHLVLNHLSITGGEDAADALRSILKLYDFHDSAQTRALIDSVHGISAQQGIARVPSAGTSGLCRGLDVLVEFEPAPFENGQGFLLATVIERFLALYVSINSFSTHEPHGCAVAPTEVAHHMASSRRFPNFFSDRPAGRCTLEVPVFPGRARPRTAACATKIRRSGRGRSDGRRGSRSEAANPALSLGDAPVVPGFGDRGVFRRGKRAARHDRDVHGAERPVFGVAAALQRCRAARIPQSQHGASRLLRLVQRPADRVLLSGMGEIPGSDLGRTAALLPGRMASAKHCAALSGSAPTTYPDASMSTNTRCFTIPDC